MGARGLGLVLVFALVGGAAGWAYGEQYGRPSISETAPAPVAAADPSIPFTPPEKTRPDSDLPPLTAQVATHDERLGTPKQGGVVVPVPNGWERVTFADSVQARWTPANAPSAGGYALRIQVLDEARTLSQKVGARAFELEADPSVSDFELLGSTVDTLKASFILDGYRKLTVIRWVSFDGNLADVEIAATGRRIDEPGMDALVARVATEVRRQRLPQTSPQKPGAATSSKTP